MSHQIKLDFILRKNQNENVSQNAPTWGWFLLWILKCSCVFGYWFQQRFRTIIIILQQSFHLCTKRQKHYFLLDLFLLSHISHLSSFGLNTSHICSPNNIQISLHSHVHNWSTHAPTHTCTYAHAHTHTQATQDVIITCIQWLADYFYQHS